MKFSVNIFPIFTLTIAFSDNFCIVDTDFLRFPEISDNLIYSQVIVHNLHSHSTHIEEGTTPHPQYDERDVLLHPVGVVDHPGTLPRHILP